MEIETANTKVEDQQLKVLLHLSYLLCQQICFQLNLPLS